MIRAEMIEAVYDELGVDRNDPMANTSMVSRAVDRALQKVSTERDWPWLQLTQTITVVAGTASYLVSAGSPAAVGFLRSLSLKPPSPAAPLAQYTVPALEDMYPSSTDVGAPRAYAIDSSTNTIVMRPVPSSADAGAWSHRFVRAEPELTTDQASPLMPDAFQDSIIYLAAGRVARNIQSDKADELLGEYKMALGRMMDDRNVGKPRLRQRRRGRWI